VSATFVICVRDFHDLCPRLSPQGSFVESRRNGIWALLFYQIQKIYSLVSFVNISLHIVYKALVLQSLDI